MAVMTVDYFLALRAALLHYFGTTDTDLLVEQWERDAKKADAEREASNAPQSSTIVPDEVGLLRESLADGGGLGLIRRHTDVAAPRRVVEIQTDMVEQGEQLASVRVNGVEYYLRDASGA